MQSCTPTDRARGAVQTHPSQKPGQGHPPSQGSAWTQGLLKPERFHLLLSAVLPGAGTVTHLSFSTRPSQLQCQTRFSQAVQLTARTSNTRRSVTRQNSNPLAFPSRPQLKTFTWFLRSWCPMEKKRGKKNHCRPFFIDFIKH